MGMRVAATVSCGNEANFFFFYNTLCRKKYTGYTNSIVLIQSVPRIAAYLEKDVCTQAPLVVPAPPRAVAPRPCESRKEVQ